MPLCMDTNRLNTGAICWLRPSVDESKLTITLEDSSPAYNPLRTPLPEDLDVEPQERPVGGLGIFLALKGVDEFQHQWVNNKNRNIFVQFLTGSRSSTF